MGRPGVGGGGGYRLLQYSIYMLDQNEMYYVIWIEMFFVLSLNDCFVGLE